MTDEQTVRPRVSEEDAAKFNAQVDEIRYELMRHLPKSPYLVDRRVEELMNRMEVARRVFNCWAETGKVEIPE